MTPRELSLMAHRFRRSGQGEPAGFLMSGDEQAQLIRDTEASEWLYFFPTHNGPRDFDTFMGLPIERDDKAVGITILTAPELAARHQERAQLFARRTAWEREWAARIARTY